MSNIPYYYTYENVIDSSIVPSEVHTRDNIIFRYFNNYLFQRAISVFDFQLPEYKRRAVRRLDPSDGQPLWT